MVKSNLLFALLLASVLVIGTFGIDIADHFLGSDNLEETVIDRSGNGLYIASPDEISFNPMEIIRNNNSYVFMEDSNSTVGKYVCSAILQCLSRGTAGAEYKYPLLESPEKAFKLSSNYYFYLKGYKYINTDGELRYADCIIDQSNYDVIYINFYNGEHYNPGTDKVNKGVDILAEYSKEFYPDFNDGESPIESVYNWAFSGLRTEELIAENVEELPEKALLYYDEVSLESFGVGDNPVELFWANSTLFSGIYFNSMLKNDLEVLKANRPYDGKGYYSIFNCQSTVAPVSMLEQAQYEYGDELLTENTEYVAYDGRIYQTINMGYNKNVNIIYNIEEDTIEGFYFPPTIR